MPPGKGTPACFFDADGTLASSNVLLAYLDFRLHDSSLGKRWARLASFLPKLPYYALLDTLSRERFSEAFFHNYANVDRSELERWAAGAAERYWKPRLYPEALQQLHQHRVQGHRIVLISGGIEPVLKPLADIVKADVLVAAQPEVEGDRLTGRLVDGPLSGERKARAEQQVADSLGIDLAQSYAYADSYSDRAFLEGVGHPVAVNPDRRLGKMARRRGWPIRIWRLR